MVPLYLNPSALAVVEYETRPHIAFLHPCHLGGFGCFHPMLCIHLNEECFAFREWYTIQRGSENFVLSAKAYLPLRHLEACFRLLQPTLQINLKYEPNGPGEPPSPQMISWQPSTDILNVLPTSTDILNVLRTSNATCRLANAASC